MKNKKIIIVVIVLLVVLVGIFFAVRTTNKNKRVNEIKEFMKGTYEKFDKYFSTGQFEGQDITFNFDDLKSMGMDIEKYEKNKCNFDKSKVTLKINGDSYDIDVELSCLKY